MYYPMANIELETLIRECSIKRKPDEDIFYDFSYKNRENVHKIFKYRKFNYDFTDKLMVYSDGNHIIGYIRPSYDDFLYSLCKFLNVPIKGKINDNEELTNEFNKQLEKLSQIQSERELKEEFSYLYNDLLEGRSFIRSVENMKRTTKEEQERYEKQRHYYYSCALKQRLDRFIETQKELYRRFINQREEYKREIESKNYNDYIRQNFDIDKMAMLIVDKYLTICEGTEDKKVLEQYAKLISKYLFSDYNLTISITLDNGNKIDSKNISSRLKNVLRRIKSTESYVEWELVPEGREYKRVTTSKENPPRITLMNYEEIERLKKKGERKRAFYESTPYLNRVVGLQKYKGYIGYIYPNGEILLDKEYKEDNPNSAIGDAIYHMKAMDFEQLSKLDKTVLRKHPNVNRIIHSKNWEEKAKMVIEQEGTEKTQEEAKKLIKRLKEKK